MRSVVGGQQAADSGQQKILRILCFVALLAIVTSFLYFRHFKEFYDFDSPGYIAPTESFVAGHGFLDAQGNPDTLRTPGYPIFIAPFILAHLDLSYLILVQHLLRVLLICGSAYAAFTLTRSPRQALLAGIVLCIDLPFLRSANTILSETLFTVVLCIALILLWREAKQTSVPGAWCLFAGLMAGATVLIRPVALFFFVPAAAYLLLVRQKYRLAAATIFVLSFAAIPLAWAARNLHRTGYLTVSSISGFSMLEYRAAGVLAINDSGDFYSNREKRMYELMEDACRNWQQMHRRDCSEMSIPEKSKYYTKYGSKIVLAHPVAYLKLMIRGVGMAMLTGSPASLSAMTGMSFNTAAKVLLLYTVPALGFAVFGLFNFWRRQRNFFWLALLTCTYFIGISAGAETFARFRVPIMPLYVILVANGVNSAINKLTFSLHPGGDTQQRFG
jgi:4-amino-4-deoxy-L-arabinose transferase-like glycosyltransferase